MANSSRRDNRSDIWRAINTQSWDDLRSLLAKRPGQVRHILSGLHSTNPKELAKTLMAFEIIAEELEIERLRDLGRKLLWMLNDESGNHCPNASLALAHIAKVHYDVIAPHIPVMRVHAEDPGDQMASICQQAITLIETDRVRSTQDAETRKEQ